MTIRETPFEGLYILENNVFRDERGSFVKSFTEELFLENGLETGFSEFYYSVNRKNVLRGMHFQLPPSDHTKLVYVSRGRVLDVVLDLRKASATYGRFFSMELDAQHGRCLYIPKGFAHGFLSLRDGSICNYAQTSVYDRQRDSGIDAFSFGFDWGVASPVRSGRDLTFPALKDFVSPF